MIHTLLGALVGALLLPAVSVRADDCRLEPDSLTPGGVTWLVCRLAEADRGEVRYRDKLIPLQAWQGGLRALLGADLNQRSGDYPLQIRSVDRRGLRRIEGLALKVTALPRSDEHLSLPQRMVSPRKPATLQRIARESRRLGDIYAGESAWLVDGWQLPVGDPLGSRFGRGRVLNGKRRSPHSGVDFRSPTGRQVLASGSGEVVLVDELYFTGLTVVLDHGHGLFGIYAHLSAADCRPGEIIEQGARVGRVGQSGRATGPHLHWSLRLHGDRVDPLRVTSALAEQPWQLDRNPPEGDNSGRIRRDDYDK